MTGEVLEHFSMSCLPLFSFAPSLSAMKSHFDPAAPRSDEQLPDLVVATSSVDEIDGLYDKIARVSVSHRRVDSFEWVMAQSAPNTPPTSLGTDSEPCSPPATRLISSAPLPVPNETWSITSQVNDRRQKRGYFDWWSSPILGLHRGYTKLSTSDVEDQSHQSTKELPQVGTPRSITPQTAQQTQTHADSTDDEIRPAQELNALGIVFPYTPPPSPPASQESWVNECRCSPQLGASRLPKRVSFSPIIDEVAPETFPEFGNSDQLASAWGSYLPSSFLIAQPPLTRTMSTPAARRIVATRPILKRSSSAHQHAVQKPRLSTEMANLAFRSDSKDSVFVASPIPIQRLTEVTPRADGLRQIGKDSGKTDSVFVEILQSTNTTRHRCDSFFTEPSPAQVTEWNS